MARSYSGPSKPRWTIQIRASAAAGSVGGRLGDRKEPADIRSRLGVLFPVRPVRSSAVLAFLRA